MFFLSHELRPALPAVAVIAIKKQTTTATTGEVLVICQFPYPLFTLGILIISPALGSQAHVLSSGLVPKRTVCETARLTKGAGKGRLMNAWSFLGCLVRFDKCAPS